MNAYFLYKKNQNHKKSPELEKFKKYTREDMTLEDFGRFLYTSLFISSQISKLLVINAPLKTPKQTLKDRMLKLYGI